MFIAFTPGLRGRRSPEICFLSRDSRPLEGCGVARRDPGARALLRTNLAISMPEYTRVELSFSEFRISDFKTIARKPDALPAVKETPPDIGYTKAREIVAMASPEATEVDGRCEGLLTNKKISINARNPLASS